MNELITNLINGIIAFSNSILMPTLVVAFVSAVCLRLLIYYTIKREAWFAKAFQKRTYEYLLKHQSEKKYSSFYVTTKHLLEKTYYELFIMRSILKRRNPDIIMDKSDRIFLVQPGCARLVKDTLKHVQFFRYDIHRPNTLDISVQILEKNPHFNKVFGYIPVGTSNEVLNLLPGIFIVCGIFGTFMGIMQALPELGAMDLADIEKTKQTMDHFLVKMAYSMITSVLGIILNVGMTFINAFFNPNKVFVDIVDRYNNALDSLWNSCTDNRLPAEIPEFDENKDPIEALAEDAVTQEVMKSKDWIKENSTEESDKVARILNANTPEQEEVKPVKVAVKKTVVVKKVEAKPIQSKPVQAKAAPAKVVAPKVEPKVEAKVEVEEEEVYEEEVLEEEIVEEIVDEVTDETVTEEVEETESDDEDEKNKVA